MDHGDYVDYYLNELKHGNTENAFHSLIEAPEAVVPLLEAAFYKENHPDIKAELLRIIAHFRIQDSVGVLSAGLEDTRPVVWKAAIDGLVILGCKKSEMELVKASENLGHNEEYRLWVKEALGQIRESRDKK